MNDLHTKSNAELDQLVAIKVAGPRCRVRYRSWSPTTDGNHRDAVLAEIERRWGWEWSASMNTSDGRQYIYTIFRAWKEGHGELAFAFADTHGRAVAIAVLAACENQPGGLRK